MLVLSQIVFAQSKYVKARAHIKQVLSINACQYFLVCLVGFKKMPHQPHATSVQVVKACIFTPATGMDGCNYIYIKHAYIHTSDVSQLRRQRTALCTISVLGSKQVFCVSARRPNLASAVTGTHILILYLFFPGCCTLLNFLYD